ncbi:unnamed protein product [Periconia digitata]|uniref:U4/U6.U5 small nuclear ribonucleoprotein 27kDa protein domain-containing protein n=1 Tax=Periconia digitata TaxID=1303443 RepID=A0A9W4UGA1_9PLEO|nr:unnamed protein product [Periconia digitata]
MADDRRDAGDRPRDRFRDRDSGHRESRAGGRDRGNSPDDRRNRSRSPRYERGGRGGRYRSRSPVRRNGRDGGDRDFERNDRRQDRDRGGPRDSRPSRDAPKGPRGAPSGPRKDLNAHPGSSKPPTGPRGDAKHEESKDIPMEDEQPARQRPEGMDDETWEMAQMMGFAGFKSTKNKKVPGNDKNYGVRKDKRMEARQYMNRQGGFNRPLSPSRM